jgi:hypothetical protein
MSRKVKWFFLITAILLTAAFLLPDIIERLDYNKPATVKADTGSAEWDETEDDPEDPSGGAPVSDAFTVLEIVPYKGLGFLGYLVDGEEPVDTSYMSPNVDTTKGNFSGLGGAVSFYNSYQEAELNPSGQVSSGWYKGKTAIYQNGYFTYVGKNKGGLYSSKSNCYVYVGQGQGDYIAKLDTEITNPYYIWNPGTNYKNVIAYFVNGRPSNVNLHNSTDRYKPILVNRNPGHGDYDYNCETKTFALNMGQGDYDVIFQKSTDNEAKYYMMEEGLQIVFDNSGDYSFDLTYESAGTNQGYLDLISSGFDYNQYNGEYKWVPDNNVSVTPSNPYNKIDNSRIEVWGQKITKEFQFTNGITMINNEWFKRLVLGVSADQVENCKVDVITMTPAELNSQGNTNIIDRANLFYINDYPENSCNIWYKNFSQAGSLDVAYNSGIHNFQLNDLSWACTEAIFKRVVGVGGSRAAVMISSNIYSSTENYGGISYSLYKDMASIYNDVTSVTTATICNTAKLYLMLMQRDIVSFYNAFMNPYTNSSFKITSVSVPTSKNPTGTTGSFVRPDQIPSGLTPEQFASAYNTAKTQDIAVYWNKITFMPYEYKEDSNTLGIIDRSLKEEFPNMNMGDTSLLHENVITMDGSEYLSNNHFIGEKSSLNSVNQSDYDSALILANSLNASDTYQTTLSIAEFLSYTTNNGQGYGSGGSGTEIAGETGEDGEEGSNLRSYVSVLNLQPTADFTASNSNIKDILKNYNVKIDNMTTTQFNSYIKDINTRYDIIYMGAGTGRFNLDGSGRTVFNQSVLSNYHYLFLPEGDKITTSLGNLNYYGNDLTEEKANAIKGFLQGGYTIILESALYGLNSTVNSSSKVYQMIHDIKSNSTLYKNVINLADNVPLRDTNGNIISSNTEKYFRFRTGLLNGLNVTRPKIELVDPVIGEEEEHNYFYPDNGNLIIHFKLEPWGIIPSSHRYNAYLYLDINGDGLFDSEDEKISIQDAEGNRRWEGITESRLRHYYYLLNLKQEELKLNGVYQWKIQVVRQDNSEIRSEVTGYAAYSEEPQEIRVLQIIDNSAESGAGLNLESEIDTPGSLIRERFGYAGTPLRDYNIIIETKTVEGFEALYAEHPYNTSNPEETGKLSLYHLLILDNQIDPIDPTGRYGALRNIKDELADDLGVIFTKGSIDFGNQEKYLNSVSLLFDDRYTYNQINRLANAAGELYIYSGLAANGNPGADSTYNTAYLTRSNKGPVTEYPYNIGDTLDIAVNSYSRSLTKEYDSDPPSGASLIGWYCLSDNKNPATNSSVEASAAYKGMYSSSPNDVNNNYYLFNRGNSYYSGIVLKSAENEGKDKEIQLFVNTIIAAFKNCGRKLTAPPVISIKQPIPDAAGVINLSRSDIGDATEVPFIFELAGSSSRMEVTISWDAPEGAAGDWNLTVYRVSGTEVSGETADMAHMDNGRYAVIIPVDDLDGSHVLTIHAENEDEKIAELRTTVNYIALPITITIDNEELIESNGKQYLYVDADFTADFGDESDPGYTDEVRIEFSIANAGEGTGVTVTDSSGAPIDITGGLIYDTEGHTYPVGATELPEGNHSYYLYIPASEMNGFGSRDITITAADDGSSASSTVTLLRRSLFPLD